MRALAKIVICVVAFAVGIYLVMFDVFRGTEFLQIIDKLLHAPSHALQQRRE